jgi:hypothetical protein
MFHGMKFYFIVYLYKIPLPLSRTISPEGPLLAAIAAGTTGGAGRDFRNR